MDSHHEIIVARKSEIAIDRNLPKKRWICGWNIGSKITEPALIEEPSQSAAAGRLPPTLLVGSALSCGDFIEGAPLHVDLAWLTRSRFGPTNVEYRRGYAASL